jgi:preprotein translocase subunit SecD
MSVKYHGETQIFSVEKVDRLGSESLTNVSIKLMPMVISESNAISDSYAILLSFTEKGGETLRDLTGRNLGRRLAVVAGGKLLAAPIITEPVSGGQIQIGGYFTKSEASAIADAIRSSMAKTHP